MMSCVVDETVFGQARQSLDPRRNVCVGVFWAGKLSRGIYLVKLGRGIF